jgi:hypothetical protein
MSSERSLNSGAFWTGWKRTPAYLKARALKREEELKPVLEEVLGTKLHLTEQYDYFDYIGDKILVELKTRNCTSYAYKETLLPLCKFLHAKRYLEKKDFEVVFFVEFRDGLFQFDWVGEEFPETMSYGQKHVLVPLSLFERVTKSETKQAGHRRRLLSPEPARA